MSETKRRFLASVINENLAVIEEDEEKQTWHLTDRQSSAFYVRLKIKDYCKGDVVHHDDITLDDSSTSLKQLVYGFVHENANLILKELENSAEMIGIELFDRKELIAKQEPVTFSVDLRETYLELEQMVIDGHPTHPCNKLRFGFSKTDSIKYCPEFKNTFKLKFLRIPEEIVYVSEKYNEILQEILGNVVLDHRGFVLIPIHPFNTEFVDKYELTSIEIECSPQASIRTLALFDDNLNFVPFNFKLPLNLTTTSSLRLISKYAIRNGPVVSEIIHKALQELNSLGFDLPLSVCYEAASAGIIEPDCDYTNISCIIRVSPDESAYKLVGRKQVKIIPSMILDQKYLKNLLAFLEIDAAQFLLEYSGLLFKCFLPLMFYGITLESHLQNSFLIVKDSAMVGFAIRDFGGIRISDKFGEKLIENSAIVSESLSEQFQLGFHCLIQMHLSFVARNLNCFDKWAIIGQALLTSLRNIKEIHKKNSFDFNEQMEEFRNVWLSSKVPFKSFLKMKMKNVNSTYIYSEVANVLYKAGTEVVGELIDCTKEI